MAKGKFVIDNAKNGIKFNLVAGNGEIIATSEVYTTKAACLNGIESVRKNSAAEIENQTAKEVVPVKGAKFEIYKDKAGEFRFRLKAGNGQIIAVGEGYKALSGCKNGIDSIKRNAPEAEIVDRTEQK